MNNYASLAAEYYDKLRHPTCANFDELSEAYLFPRFKNLIRPQARILEVGAGRSKVAAFLESSSTTVESVVLLDNSAEMLKHSDRWIGRGARGVVANAQDTKLDNEKFSLIVSSLGDPYNTQEFWHEVHRLLDMTGTCLFTTPAAEWVAEFRPDSAKSSAEFIRADGMVVLVDSFVPPNNVQYSMFQAASLNVLEEIAYRVSDLRGAISSKLRVRGDIPVLRGYRLEKARRTAS